MREYPQMKLRLPPQLKELIEASSKYSGRSMNAEIVHRLEVSFIADQNSAAASLLQGDGIENVLTPTLSASMASKVARQNTDTGISIASLIVDEINELIHHAIIIGKYQVIFDTTKVTEKMPATEKEISTALKLVQKAFDDAGYLVKIKDGNIVISY
jgi:hypothetical protein